MEYITKYAGTDLHRRMTSWSPRTTEHVTLFHAIAIVKNNENQTPSQRVSPSYENASYDYKRVARKKEKPKSEDLAVKLCFLHLITS